ncbi:DUF2442 domain-containing protein [Chromatiaceae bacterium AAb-1]|nr:DUF2442 domain-containing protein [Chromatiaceae bacterium AAb-1]
MEENWRRTSSGKVDLDGILNGPIFEPLKEIAIFQKVSVDPELETVVWPNVADLAPEFLKGYITNRCSQYKKHTADLFVISVPHSKQTPTKIKISF